MAGDYLERLKAAAGEVARQQLALLDAKERRDRLIFEANDSGMATRRIAAAVGMSQPGVMHILSRPQPWFADVAAD